MAASRRDTETRNSRERAKAWKPADLLPVPDPQDGVTFRWVRVGSRGTPDNKNISSRLREGWEPVNAADHPELRVMSDDGSRFKDGVEIGGLLLCKTSNETARARNEYYRNRSKEQLSAIDNHLLRESDPRMPLYAPQRRTRTTIGNGSFGSSSDEE